MKNIIFIFCIFFIFGCTQNVPESTGNKCSIDLDCQLGFVGPAAGNNAGAPVPNFGAFCVQGQCKLSTNSNKPFYEQWLDSCNEHKQRGATYGQSDVRTGQSKMLEECYSAAANSALNKEQYDFTKAFYICNTYFFEKSDLESCKTNVCNNLRTEKLETISQGRDSVTSCFMSARETSSCYDGIKNGGELNVDCGADCELCGIEAKCVFDYDCANNNCASFYCLDICEDGLVKDNKPCSCEGLAFNEPSFVRTDFFCCNNKQVIGAGCS